ncbi:MAG: hypothetical protein PHC62_00890 [Candidatus Izemoplasmatales bacterium]|nr:hypothetical protein [Candidatus Izemoplasmatales bacterium]
MELWERKNYLSDIPFMFNTYIREYDISKANINILLWKQKITQEYYHQLLNSPRNIRQYEVGMLQRNNEDIKLVLEEGFKECRKMFFESNELTDIDILSIKNDAIFIVNKIPKYTEFENIVFLNKNTYTSYMSLYRRNIELYYQSNRLTGEDHVDVKGISDTKLQYHKPYFLDFIYYFFDMIQNDGLDNLITNFQMFFNDYINRKLDVGYYRSFNETSSFMLDWNRTLNPSQRYMIDSLEMASRHADNINFSFNMNLLREIYGYISSIYFMHH